MSSTISASTTAITAAAIHSCGLSLLHGGLWRQPALRIRSLTWTRVGRVGTANDRNSRTGPCCAQNGQVSAAVTAT